LCAIGVGGEQQRSQPVESRNLRQDADLSIDSVITRREPSKHEFMGV
jgi:hypothetical protein